MLLLVLIGLGLLLGAGAIVIGIIGGIASLFQKSSTTEKSSNPLVYAQAQEKSVYQQQQILSKENHIVGTSCDTANVKCTYCGTKAFVKGDDIFYICPVCHRKVDIASAKNSFQNPQMTKAVSHNKAQEQHYSSKPSQSCYATTSQKQKQ